MQHKITQNVNTGKGQSRHPLSSGAYFDARHESTHTSNIDTSEYTPMRAAALVKPAQRRRIRHEKPAKITVYADMITVKYPDYANGVIDRDRTFSGGGIRGNICGFSRASRKRMIEFMAKVRNYGDMYFVTMTYDDMSWLQKHDDHHSDFEAFRRRFERAFPNFRAIWRVEVKERLSGILKGNNVPHFHLLVFTNRRDSDEDKEANEQGLQAWGVGAWGEILHAENPSFTTYGFHVNQVRSRKHAYSYVSKYIAKMDEDGIEAGRRWGRIGQFDTTSSESLVLSDDEALEFKRMVRKWLKNRNKEFQRKLARTRNCTGYSIFGLGDTLQNGTNAGLFSLFSRMVIQAKFDVGERIAREAGKGD